MKTRVPSSFTIGQAAKQLGVNIQTLRFYERIGLLEPAARQDSGYRLYDNESVKRVGFVKRAQDLGFSLDEIKDLLTLEFRSPKSRDRAQAKARERLSIIREKIKELRRLERTLERLIHDCENQKTSGPCPILQKMEGR